MNKSINNNIIPGDTIINSKQVKPRTIIIKKTIFIFLFISTLILITIYIFINKPHQNNHIKITQYSPNLQESILDIDSLGQITQVELFFLIETGGAPKSLSYMYWDSDRFVYHRNQLPSTISYTHPSNNIECQIPSSVLDEINKEFKKTYSLNVPTNTDSTLNPYGRVYLFTFENGSEMVIYSISPSITDQQSALYIRETKEKYEYPDNRVETEILKMREESKVVPFDSGSLTKLLYDLSMKIRNYENDQNCNTMNADIYMDKIVYEP